MIVNEKPLLFKNLSDLWYINKHFNSKNSDSFSCMLNNFGLFKNYENMFQYLNM